MKLIGFVCTLALAVAVVGCGDDDTNGTGGNGTGGSGGTAATGGNGTGGNGTGGNGGGTGNTGGDGNCTNAADTAVYDSAEYTNPDGTFTGTDAVSTFAADCLDPTCGPEVGMVLANNNPTTQQALATCVEECVAGEFALTSACIGCYGDSVTCGAANCAGECATGDVNQPPCLTCRCGDNDAGVNCFGDFDTCSGLPREPDLCEM